MASSGQITIYTESVDYGGGRGAVTLTNVVGWSVNDNSDISFWSISSSDNVGGYWGICYGSGPYYVRLVPQVSYDNGGSWVNLDMKTHLVNSQCTVPPDIAHYTNTITMSVTLINQLGSYHLSGDCQLRFLYYMDPTPAPSSSNPNAFPNSSYSEAVQVPVHIDVSWTATLNYNANGGSGAPGPTTATVTGDSVNLTISGTRPTRTNYRFEGWATSSSATTAQYQPGGTFTVQKGNPTRTLYAVWRKYYHPGKVWNGSAWMSHDREPGGDARVKSASSWKDMRTIDAPTGKNDPPSIYHDGDWFNMRDIGTH